MDPSLEKLYRLFTECDLFKPTEPRLLCNFNGTSQTVKSLQTSDQLTFSSIDAPPLITDFRFPEDQILICGPIYSLFKAWACKNLIE